MWKHHSGPTPTDRTGPDYDHTFERYNASGHYLFVNMNQNADDADKRPASFASNAIMNSVIFNPPPYAHSNASSIYHHSCMVRIIPTSHIPKIFIIRNHTNSLNTRAHDAPITICISNCRLHFGRHDSMYISSAKTRAV